MDSEISRKHDLTPDLHNVVLASTLWDIERAKRRTSSAGQLSKWSTGIKRIDTAFENTWDSGGVIGFGSIDDDPKIPIHLLSTSLIQTRDSTAKLKVYLVSLPNKRTITDVYNLTVKNLQRSTVDREKTALTLLESVQLLQYLDLAGLAETLIEISSRLREDHGSQNSHTDTPTHKSMLVVQGLSNTLTATLRQNGLVQTNTLLLGILRTVTRISRTYLNLLTVVELDVEVKSGSGADKGASELESAFSNDAGSIMRLEPAGVIGRTLFEELDILVLTHDGYEKSSNHKPVVEVVKDRLSSNLGVWTTWPSLD